MSKDRLLTARQILAKYHTTLNDPDNPLVHLEMEEITTAIRAEDSTSVWDMVRTGGNRHRLFISITLGIFAQWSGTGVVSYYLPSVLTTIGVTDVTPQTLINAFLQLFNLIVALSASLCVDRFGRRSLFLTSSIGMLISFAIVSGLSGAFATTHRAGVGLAVIPFLYIYFGFYDIAFTPLLAAYPTEIWTFAHRTRGVAATFMSTQAALAFNVFVNPIALQSIGWKYYTVFAGLLVVVLLVVYLFYPETKGCTLEEVGMIFDGNERRENVFEITRRDEVQVEVFRNKAFFMSTGDLSRWSTNTSKWSRL